MGHILFLILHFFAIMFGFIFLIVTIPMHLIYSASRSSAKSAKKNKPSPKTHFKCPDCKEFVLKDARVCKHCGCEFVLTEA